MSSQTASCNAEDSIRLIPINAMNLWVRCRQRPRERIMPHRYYRLSPWVTPPLKRLPKAGEGGSETAQRQQATRLIDHLPQRPKGKVKPPLFVTGLGGVPS